MKKLLPLVALAFGLMAHQASADVIFTSENILENPIYMNGDNGSYSFTHDMTLEGYVPGTEIFNGQLSLLVRDDGRDPCSWLGCQSEYFVLNLNVLNWLDASQPHEIELGALGLLSVWVDGDYTYHITRVWGDFYFGGSTLTITAAEAVPEPATLAMLGLGLLGFGAARRRRA